MKVIDLLNKIANGEIKHNTKFRIHFSDKLHRDFYYDWYETCPLLSLKVGNGDLFQDDFDWNDEVEIIEEDKKIEKLDKYAQVWGDIACEWSRSEKKLKAKIDELIDEVNKLKENK